MRQRGSALRFQKQLTSQNYVVKGKFQKFPIGYDPYLNERGWSPLFSDGFAICLLPLLGSIILASRFYQLLLCYRLRVLL